MKTLIILTFVALASASVLKDIDDINSQNVGWTAAPNKFTYMTADERKQYLGTIIVDYEEKPNPEAEILREFISLPAEFDARKQWPSCVHPIRD